MKPSAQFVCVLIALYPAAAQSDAAPSVMVGPVAMEKLQKPDRIVGRVVADQSVGLQARVEGFWKRSTKPRAGHSPKAMCCSGSNRRNTPPVWTARKQR